MLSIISVIDNEELFSSPSLKDLSLQVCVSQANTLLFAPPKRKILKGKESVIKIRDDLILPIRLWEELLECYGQRSANYFILLKAINEKVPGIRNIDLSNYVKLTDAEFLLAIQTYPYSLAFHNCPLLTKKAFEILNEFGCNLEYLNIGNSSQIIPHDLKTWLSTQRDKKDKPKLSGIRKFVGSINKYFKQDVPKPTETGKLSVWNSGLLHTPHLRKLVIWELQVVQIQDVLLDDIVTFETPARDCESSITKPITYPMDFWDFLTRQFIDKLEYLDLSGCHELTKLSFLLKAKRTLKVLHLHDVLLDFEEATFKVLRGLPELKYLNLSQHNELAAIFSNPDETLKRIIDTVPNLTGLDISGTNLAGFGPSTSSECSIKGLLSRVNRPLSFLGLLTTHYNASLRNNIPALTICGGGNFSQLVTSLQHYLHHISMSRKVIRIMQDKLLPQQDNQEEFIPCQSLLDLLSQVMRIHINDKHIQIIASATVFHLLKRIYMGNNTPLGKHRQSQIIDSIIGIVSTYSHDMSLLRNSVLIFLLLVPHLHLDNHISYAEMLATVFFNIANAVLEFAGGDSPNFFFTESVANLIFVIVDSGSEAHTKLQNIETIKLLLSVIQQFVSKNLFEHLPIFWMILYRILDSCTDAHCCEVFLEAKGPSVSFEYMKFCNELRSKEGETQGTIAELIQAQIPIIALLTNLFYHAPSHSRRKILQSYCTSLHIPELIEILEMKIIETEDQQLLAYLTSGLLVSIYAMKDVSNRKACSPYFQVSRNEVLSRAFQIVSNMEMSRTDLTFRNLGMLYEMLESHNAPETNYWALKTLVNLLVENPDKFGDMIAKDGKLMGILNELMKRKSTQLKPELEAFCNSIFSKMNMN